MISSKHKAINIQTTTLGPTSKLVILWCVMWPLCWAIVALLATQPLAVDGAVSRVYRNRSTVAPKLSPTTISYRAINWTKLCPCRVCEMNSSDVKRIVCDQGGLNKIPVSKIPNFIEVIEVTAPTNKSNNLTLGPLFYRFSQLKKLQVIHSNIPAIGHSTFRYRTNLLELDLSYNRIEHLIDSNFRGLSQLKVLNLSHNHLQDLTSGTFQHLISLQHLSLAHNRLQTITTRLFFNMTSIDSLDLSDNPIGEITPQNAIDLYPLRRLYLANCRLKRLHSLFYRNLPSLQLLDLRHNEIEQIHMYEFRYLKNLSELLLDHNRLGSISGAAFFGNSLTKLGLSMNQLTVLEEDTFANCTVVELDLSHNNFTSFAPKTFEPVADYLQVLSLTDIPSLKDASVSVSRLLAPLRQLRKVQLSNLNLDSVNLASEMFSTFRNTLRSVNLSHNSLVNLSARLIDEVVHLEEFDLSYNSLYELSSEFLYTLSLFKNLTFIYLDHNPWSCYRCHLLYFRNWIAATPNAYQNACEMQNRCAICQYPPNLEGYQVHQMEEWQLEWCTDPTVQLRVSTTEPNVGLVLALLIIIILIIVIVGVIVYYRNRGAIYFTNEDLLYARSSTMEDKSGSVYNISNAIRYFADATASPVQSVHSSSAESAYHSRKLSNGLYTHINGKREPLAHSVHRPINSEAKVYHKARLSSDARRAKGSTSSSVAKSRTHLYEDECTENSDRLHSTSRYRMLKHRSSSNLTEDEHSEPKSKSKSHLLTRGSVESAPVKQSTVSLSSTASSVSGSTSASDKSHSTSSATNRSRPISLPSALPPYDHQSSASGSSFDSSPGPNSKIRPHVLQSKSSAESLTAALAEGDAASTSPSSGRSSDLGTKSPSNE